jgi:hypothetical protein
MSLSLNLTSAASFQAYVQDYHRELLRSLYLGFDSGKLMTAHSGVKGKKLLTQMTVGALVKRYSSTFAPTSNAINFIPRNLEVSPAKVDLKFIPLEFRDTYLGMELKVGSDAMDLPFEGYILNDLLSKIAQEQEYAIWRAAKAGTPASTDLLIALFDGIREVIKAEITATNLTPVATGAITNTNAVASVEAVHAALGDAYLKTTVDIFLNPIDKIKFIQDYRERYGKYTDKADGSISLETGNAMIHVLSGVPANCILATPKENLHYGFDGPMDASAFNFEQEDRTMKLWMDLQMGFNFGIVNDDIMAVNNQWTV